MISAISSTQNSAPQNNLQPLQHSGPNSHKNSKSNVSFGEDKLVCKHTPILNTIIAGIGTLLGPIPYILEKNNVNIFPPEARNWVIGLGFVAIAIAGLRYLGSRLIQKDDLPPY